MVLRGLALLEHAASSPQLVADVALLERKAAAQRHDTFNVYTVPVLVVLTFASLAAQQRGTTAQAYYAHLALSAATCRRSRGRASSRRSGWAVRRPAT